MSAQRIEVTTDQGHLEIPLDELQGVSLDDLKPRRDPDSSSWYGRRARSGWHHWSKTGRMNPFESLNELDQLRGLEYDPSTTAMTTQTFEFVGDFHHIPDFLLETDDGARWVVDARTIDRMDEAADIQFSRTRDLCVAAGLRYAVLDDADPDVLRSPRPFLHYRHARQFLRKQIEETMRLLTDVPASLSDVLTAFPPKERPAVVASLRHLIYTGEVHATQSGFHIDGLSTNGHLWRHDPARSFRLREHLWTAERAARAAAWQPPKPVTVTATRSYPSDAAVLSTYTDKDRRGAERQFDVLARYAAAVGRKNKHERLKRYAASLPGPNPYSGMAPTQARLAARMDLGRWRPTPGNSTFYNLLNTAEASCSPWSLLPDNGSAVRPEQRHPEWFAAAVDYQLRTADGPALGVDHRLFRLRDLFQDEHPELPMPSRADQRAMLAAAEKQTRTAGHRATVRGNQAVPPDHGYWLEAVPGNLQLDSTRLDVRLRHPYLPGVRISQEVTMLMDVASRQPVAVRVHDVGTSADVVVDLLLQLASWPASDRLTGRLGQPDDEVPFPHDAPLHEPFALAGRPIPTVVGATPNVDGEPCATVERALPQVACAVLTIDAGAAERSARVMRLLAKTGVTVVFAGRRSGYHKPHVERFFRTVRTSFVTALPGYTGGRQSNRGRDPDATPDTGSEAAVTPDDVERLLLNWIHNDWANRVQRYENRFGRALIDMTPRMYLELSGQLHGRAFTRVEPEDIIESMHQKLCSVQSTMITLHLRTYDARPLIAEGVSLAGTGNKVAVAYPRKGSDYIFALVPAERPYWIRLLAKHPFPDQDATPAAWFYEAFDRLSSTRHAMSGRDAKEQVMRRVRDRNWSDYGIEEQFDDAVPNGGTPTSNSRKSAPSSRVLTAPILRPSQDQDEDDPWT